jgi:hypothetical protein
LRTITIQADKPLDAIMERWLAHLVLAIPVGPDGIKFDGDLSNGTTVNQRAEGQWTVSFRPNPDGSKRRAYSNPYAVARVIIAREHETVTNLPARDVTAPALRASGCPEGCPACCQFSGDDHCDLVSKRVEHRRINILARRCRRLRDTNTRHQQFMRSASATADHTAAVAPMKPWPRLCTTFAASVCHPLLTSGPWGSRSLVLQRRTC